MQHEKYKKKNTSSFGVCVVDNNKRETQMRERAYPMEDQSLSSSQGPEAVPQENG